MSRRITKKLTRRIANTLDSARLWDLAADLNREDTARAEDLHAVAEEERRHAALLAKRGARVPLCLDFVAGRY